MPAWAKGITPSQGRELSSADILTSMPWRIAAIADDRRSITVAFFAGDGDCVNHVGYYLLRAGDEVTLGEYSRVAGGPACSDRAVRGVETVTLPVALNGSVVLVHALVSEAYSNPENLR